MKLVHYDFVKRYALEKKKNKEWAKEFSVSCSTISKWIIKYKDQIKIELEKRNSKLQNIFESYTKTAFETLKELLKSESENVRLNASKTILQKTNVHDEKKISHNAPSLTINFIKPDEK